MHPNANFAFRIAAMILMGACIWAGALEYATLIGILALMGTVPYGAKNDR